MEAHYLVSLGAANLLKSKRRSDKAVSFPQADMERIFHVHMNVEGGCIVV